MTLPTPVDAPRTARIPGAVVALIIAVVCWDPVTVRSAEMIIDDSWRYVLQRAAADRVDFASDLAFTYGPLIALDGGPMFSQGGGALAMVVALVLSWSFALLVLRQSLAAGFSKWPARALALVATLVLITPLRFSETVALTMAGWLLSALSERRDAPGLRLGAAVLAGVWCNVKPNVGLAMIILVVAASGLTKLRTAGWTRAAAAAAASGALAVGTAWTVWTASGQPIGSFPASLGNSLEVARGFAGGMTQDSLAPTFEVVLLLSALAIVVQLALHLTAESARTAAAPLLFTIAVFVWARQVGLTRPDAGHMKDAGIAVAVVAVALWPRLGRRFCLAVATPAFLIVGFLVVGSSDYETGRPWNAGPIHLVENAMRVINADETLTGDRAELVTESGLPPSMVQRIGGSSVHVAPWLSVHGFLYDLDLRYPPTVQHYTSYTNHLEEQSADALLSADGPDFVLHQYETTIDEHRSAWESPATMVAIWCAFEPSLRSDEWTLLDRADGTCESSMIADGLPVDDGSVTVPDEVATCPGIVTFRVHGTEAPWTDVFTHLALRPAMASVTIAEATWPFIAATAEQPHIIAAPADATWLGSDMPTTSNAPAELAFSESFAAPNLAADFECWTREQPTTR